MLTNGRIVGDLEISKVIKSKMVETMVNKECSLQNSPKKQNSSKQIKTHNIFEDLT